MLVRLLKEGIIEIRCRGELDGHHTSYIPELIQLIVRLPGRACLLFETLGVVHFTPAFALSHLDFLRSYQRRIQRIAVVYTLPSVPMSILAVSVSSGLEIQGFPGLDEALRWLESPGN
ncbi:MAG: STAS/SEC14 domain-containing protein [Myxococcales bacterium]